MSKAMDGGKSSAMESTKKRTPHITPTHRQLAYLDELKTHLLLMRERQAIFMEQTAKMLTGISTVDMVDNSVLHEKATDGAETDESEVKESKSNPNIKKLIQRFEDLRQTSQKFTDLPDVPEEFVNVDVRRILKGYEKLIEEGNIIQQSWLLLKNTTESCVRFANNSVFTNSEDQDKSNNLTNVIAEVSGVAPNSCEEENLPQEEGSTSENRNTVELEDKDWKVHEPKKDVKASSNVKHRGQPRWGPFLRMIIRMLKPLYCNNKGPKKDSTSTMMASMPPKKPKKTRMPSLL